MSRYHSFNNFFNVFAFIAFLEIKKLKSERWLLIKADIYSS